jgi:secretion/DNA translocation related TadE-like protein
MSRSGRHEETGIATVSAAVSVGLLMVVAAALVQVGLVLAVKHRVQAAADLAAVAGSAASLGGGDGCAVAAATARRNDAGLARCHADLAVVTVRADRVTDLIWGTRYRAHADARAAPDFYVPAGSGDASRSSRSNRRTAPALSSGSLPLPHLGDWMHDGHPEAHAQFAIRSRVIASH